MRRVGVRCYGASAVERRVRTFVGLRCGPAVRRRLHAQGERLMAGERVLRVPAIEDLHTTVQFLGTTDQGDITPIGRALQEAVGDLPPIAVAYRGLGAFPNVQRPRVVWAGVHEEDPAEGRLAHLVDAVGRALRPLGFKPEARRFHAHVTLARIRGRPSERFLETLRSAPPDLDLGGETLSELKLMLSDPGHRPYHYIDLTTVEFGG